MAKGFWKWFIVGLKLMVVGIVAFIPFGILSGLLTMLGMPGLNLLLSLPILFFEIVLYGFLVLKWRKWIFD